MNISYAVTDRKIYTRVKKKIICHEFDMFEGATFLVDKSNNVGRIHMEVKSQWADMRGMGGIYMYGIKDPERVCRIVNDALAKYNESKGSVNNG